MRQEEPTPLGARGVDFSGDMTEAYRWMTDGLLAMRNVYELLG